MKKKITLSLLIILSLLTITGCKNSKANNKVNDIEFVSNIEINKEQYIEQLKKISINGTNDYLIITKKRKWQASEHQNDETISFAISIPYTLHVDGKDYSAEYCLGDCYNKNNDGNPKYDFEIINLTNNYETKILINNKKL